MKIPAKLKYLRIAPRKVRLVADLIRGKSAQEAKAILDFTRKGAASSLAKLLRSAIASAKHNHQINESNLYISEIFVDEGPKLKRWRTRARGAVAEIQKRTSHITIVLETEEKKSISRRKVKKRKVIKKEEEKIKTEKTSKPTRPKPKKEIKLPKTKGGFRRFFRRKSFGGAAR